MAIIQWRHLFKTHHLRTSSQPSKTHLIQQIQYTQEICVTRHLQNPVRKLDDSLYIFADLATGGRTPRRWAEKPQGGEWNNYTQSPDLSTPSLDSRSSISSINQWQHTSREAGGMPSPHGHLHSAAVSPLYTEGFPITPNPQDRRVASLSLSLFDADSAAAPIPTSPHHSVAIMTDPLGDGSIPWDPLQLGPGNTTMAEQLGNFDKELWNPRGVSSRSPGPCINHSTPDSQANKISRGSTCSSPNPQQGSANPEPALVRATSTEPTHCRRPRITDTRRWSSSSSTAAPTSKGKTRWARQPSTSPPNAGINQRSTCCWKNVLTPRSKTWSRRPTTTARCHSMSLHGTGTALLCGCS